MSIVLVCSTKDNAELDIDKLHEALRPSRVDFGCEGADLYCKQTHVSSIG